MSERDEMRERWFAFAKARDVTLNFGTEDALDFAQREYDRGWNEALEKAAEVLPRRESGWRRDWVNEAIGIALSIKRPQPPAQQDDTDKPETQADAPAASAAERPSEHARASCGASPAPFDVARRAYELLRDDEWHPEGCEKASRWTRLAIQLARETAAEILAEIDKRRRACTVTSHALIFEEIADEVVRRHCLPPEPAPETPYDRERRARMERVIQVVREALGGGA